jgi:hypothetical protein
MTISVADRVRLLECELEDAKRNAGTIGAAFRDVFNDVGELQQVRERFDSVQHLIQMYEGFARE